MSARAVTFGGFPFVVVGLGAEVVPEVGADAVAQVGLVDVGGIKNPVVVVTESEEAQVRFLSVVAQEFDGEGVFRVVAC